MWDVSCLFKSLQVNWKSCLLTEFFFFLRSCGGKRAREWGEWDVSECKPPSVTPNSDWNRKCLLIQKVYVYRKPSAAPSKWRFLKWVRGTRWLWKCLRVIYKVLCELLFGWKWSDCAAEQWQTAPGSEIAVRISVGVCVLCSSLRIIIFKHHNYPKSWVDVQKYSLW